MNYPCQLRVEKMCKAIQQEGVNMVKSRRVSVSTGQLGQVERDQCKNLVMIRAGMCCEEMRKLMRRKGAKEYIATFNYCPFSKNV
jgi:hypothetical protein